MRIFAMTLAIGFSIAGLILFYGGYYRLSISKIPTNPCAQPIPC